LRLKKKNLPIWIVVGVVGLTLFLQPVLADDFILLLGFAFRTEDLSLWDSFNQEFEHQALNLNDRFLPIGWVASSALLTFSKFLSYSKMFDLESSFSFTRLILIVITITIAWKSYSITQISHGVDKLRFLRYLTYLALTIQLHALWGHDSILSYSSTTWVSISLASSYFLLLEVKSTKKIVALRLIVAICGPLVHEIFLAVFAYLLTYLFQHRNNSKKLLMLLPEAFYFLGSLMFILLRASQPSMTYEGIQLGGIDKVPTLMFGQILSMAPFSTWPLYVYSLFTENFRSLYLIAAALLTILLFSCKKSIHDLFTSNKQNNRYLNNSALLAFLFALAIGTSISEKYQQELFYIPGNTYLSYSFGWIFFPFVFDRYMFNILQSKVRIYLLSVLLLINFFVFCSSAMVIQEKFKDNSDLMQTLEAGTLSGACEFRRKLITVEYSKEYKERIENVIKQKALLPKLCSDFQGGSSEVGR
jgi:hypothetical protein